MEYDIIMLVTGTVTKRIKADSPEEAREIAQERYGDRSISLCEHCSETVQGLTISEDSDTYEVEEYVPFL